MTRPSRRPPLYGDRYRGRVAVVTGASSGLGRQLCLDLVHAGATVVGLARNAERLDALAQMLNPVSPSSHMVVCDVTDTDRLRATLASVIEMHGSIDLLINNAAQDPGVRLTDITVEDFRRTFDVNFFAPVAAHVGRPPLHAGTRLGDDRQRVVRRRPTSLAGSGRLPGIEVSALGVQRVDLVPPGSARNTSPRGVPGLHGDRARAGRLAPGSASAASADRPQRRGGLTHYFGAGWGILAGDERIEAYRRGHGVPSRFAQVLPPGSKELVNVSLRSALTAAVSLGGTGS